MFLGVNSNVSHLTHYYNTHSDSSSTFSTGSSPSNNTQRKIYLQGTSAYPSGSCGTKCPKINNTLKERVNKLFVKPATFLEFVYHAIIFIVIVSSVITIFIRSAIKNYDGFIEIDILFNVLVLIIYITEMTLRIWSCNINLKYSRYGRKTFFNNFYNLIDVTVIVTTSGLIILDIFGSKHRHKMNFLNIFILIFEGLQTLRLFRFEKYIGSFKLMFKVIWLQRKVLIAAITTTTLAISFTAFVLQFLEGSHSNFEHDDQKKVLSISDSFYLCVITFFTVGYGDLSPVTAAGRAFMCIMCFFGVALTALPTSIVGSSFVYNFGINEKLQNHSLMKNISAMLVQRAWKLRKVRQLNSRDLLSFQRIMDYNKSGWRSKEKVLPNKPSFQNLTIYDHIIVTKVNEGDISTAEIEHKLRILKLALTFIRLLQFHTTLKMFKQPIKEISSDDIFEINEKNTKRILDSLNAMKLESEKQRDRLNQFLDITSYRIEHLQMDIKNLNHKLDANIEKQGSPMFKI